MSAAVPLAVALIIGLAQVVVTGALELGSNRTVFNVVAYTRGTRHLTTSSVKSDSVARAHAGLLRDYLNSEVGPKFTPPITFRIRDETSAAKYDEPLKNEIDFTFTDATTAACLESEFLHSPLVMQRVYISSRGGGRYDVNEFGGVVVTLKKRTDIQALRDLANRTVSAPDTQILHQHQRAMAGSGVDLVADAGQLRVGALDSLVTDVLAEKTDATLLYAEEFEVLSGEVRDRLRVLNATTHRTLGQASYPLQTTSDLQPGDVVMAAPHVPWELQRQVVLALLSLNSSSAAGRSAEGFAAFQPAVSYGGMRTLMQDSGLMTRNPVLARYECIRAGDLYGNIACPPGSYRKRREEVAAGCAGRTCPAGYECVCQPCLRAAHDVQVVVVSTHDHWDEDENPELYEDKHLEAQLEECKKMQKCGILHQREELQYIIDDHLLRPEMQVGLILQTELNP